VRRGGDLLRMGGSKHQRKLHPPGTVRPQPPVDGHQRDIRGCPSSLPPLQAV
jgi:hypothetical protein